MSLRELIKKASRDLSLYRNPDTDECKARLNEILIASGQPSISHNALDQVYIEDGQVYVETSWSVRSCPDSATYSFPEYIIDAEDPIKAATIWGLNQRIEEKKSLLNLAKRNVESYERDIAKLTKELENQM